RTYEGVAVAELVLADVASPPPSSSGADNGNEGWLFDLTSLAASKGIELRVELGDVSDPDYCRSVVGSPSREGEGLSVFHLGAVMSGAPPDLALKVNLHGTIHMLEAVRAWTESSSSSGGGPKPTFVFSSAGATLGSGHPADWVSHADVISDATRAAPHTTYGTSKACAELLLADYSRRNFLDGRGARLPSVLVRAGSPNAATTSCFSSAVREPLSGRDAAVPLGPDVKHAATSYRAAVNGMLALHDADPASVEEVLGYDRTAFLPTVTVSLRELEEATKKAVTTESISKLGKVIYEEDEALSAVVGSFPTKVDAARALKLGAPPAPSIEEAIREYCEDFPNALAEGVTLRPAEEEKSEFSPSPNRVVALITGGGSGIGRAAALRLARGQWGGIDGKGGDEDGNVLRVGLVLVGRRADALDETKELIREGNSDADVLTVSADIAVDSDVNRVFEAVEANFGRVDLLFNNAGINVPPSSFEEVEPSDFEKVMEVNVTACWRMAREAARIMKVQSPRKGGRIVNNGSVSAYSPRPGSAPYTASKHAVLGLTKSLALDGRPHAITCGQVDFGNVASSMTSAVGGSKYSMSAGMPQADGSIKPEPTFDVEDAAGAVHAMAALPPGANVSNMTVMASGMPYVGRG
ncbi:hypothetical protein ACHAWF_003322, partial [Thalassiosira exigua]